MDFYNGNDNNNILLIETTDCNILDNSQLQPLKKIMRLFQVLGQFKNFYECLRVAREKKSYDLGIKGTWPTGHQKLKL